MAGELVSSKRLFMKNGPSLADDRGAGIAIILNPLWSIVDLSNCHNVSAEYLNQSIGV